MAFYAGFSNIQGKKQSRSKFRFLWLEKRGEEIEAKGQKEGGGDQRRGELNASALRATRLALWVKRSGGLWLTRETFDL